MVALSRVLPEYGNTLKGLGMAEAYLMLRNSASGPEIELPGQISAGLSSGKPQNRLFGRHSAGRRAEFEVFCRDSACNLGVRHGCLSLNGHGIVFVANGWVYGPAGHLVPLGTSRDQLHM